MKISAIDWELRDFKIPATFYKKENSQGLLVVFPGGGYPSMGPALYYPTNLYLDKKFDVLSLEYDFKRFKYDGDRDIFLKDLGNFIFKKITLDFKTDQIHLIAKSIGTRIIALTYESLEKELKNQIQKVTLLTPVWNQPEILDKLLIIGKKSFHVIGTADTLYDQKVEEVLSQKGIRYLTITKADHGLDIEGDVSKSIHELGKMTSEIEKFINLC
jgi:hypothetical protein